MPDASKIASDWFGYLYGKGFNLDVVRFRPFAWIGTHKQGDVASDLARRIVAIERGAPAVLTVGRTDVARALVGSEGTCVTVLEATCRLVESPPERVLLVVAYPDIYQCADHVPEIMAHQPIGLEGFDDLLVGYTRARGINSEGLALLPEGGGWLLVGFGAETLREASSSSYGKF